MSIDLLRLEVSTKLEAVQLVGQYFTAKGYKIIDIDVLRPWGFYFYFDVNQTKKFTDEFFADVELTGIDTNLPLQPKVLVFEPGKQNSWQYHRRRAEIWRVITQSMQAASSQTDEQPESRKLKFGEVVNFEQGIRHRGGGAKDNWGAVAEIWQHTDPHNLSDEADIVRLADDYGRA